MNKFFVGIDIGTSSIKALAKSSNASFMVKKKYQTNNLEEYVELVKEIINELIIKTDNSIDSIAFSSQTGTFVIDDKEMISWKDNKGNDELNTILKDFSKEDFLKEIGMNHPKLISYPLVKLLYIKNNYSNVKKVCQLKDYIVEKLTGSYVSDQYTYRGLVHDKTMSYSSRLLSFYNLNYKLPKIVNYSTVVGQYKGIDIIVGLNDFYSGILGVGVLSEGVIFDLSGTSEHIGYISNEFASMPMSTPYFGKIINYGNTKSSGSALSMSNSIFGSVDENIDFKNVPLFLPYLNGERAPIFDKNAKGMFFGITDKTSKKEFTYSIYEGICFSLRHILEGQNVKVDTLIVSGGAANVNALNQLKADILKLKVKVCKEKESSCFGAYLLSKYKDSVLSSIEDEVEYETTIIPNEKNKDIYDARYELYKELYITNKNLFLKLK